MNDHLRPAVFRCPAWLDRGMLFSSGRLVLRSREDCNATLWLVQTGLSSRICENRLQGPASLFFVCSESQSGPSALPHMHAVPPLSSSNPFCLRWSGIDEVVMHGGTLAKAGGGVGEVRRRERALCRGLKLTARIRVHVASLEEEKIQQARAHVGRSCGRAKLQNKKKKAGF